MQAGDEDPAQCLNVCMTSRRWCVQAEDEGDAAAVVLSLLSPQVPAPAAAGAPASVLELPVDLAGAAALPCAPVLLPGLPVPVLCGIGSLEIAPRP